MPVGRSPFILVSLLALSLEATAQEPQANPSVEKTDGKPAKEYDECDDGFFGVKEVAAYCKNQSSDLEFAILPGVFTTKETSLGFSLYGEVSFYAASSEKTQASRIILSLAYTLNNQFLVRAPALIHFKNNDLVVDGFTDFRIYPNRYYGIGNNSGQDYQVYSEDVLTTFYEARKRLYGPLYVGLVWNLRSTFGFDEREYYDKFEKENDDVENGPLAQENPHGSESNLSHGLGVEAVFDTRDDYYYPTRGGSYKAYVNLYREEIGSDFNYLLVVVDARQYISLATDHILAFQFLNEFRSGSVPFSSLSEMGGPWAMRGYFKGRYRDKSMSVLQAEYRFPVYKRLSGVAFANAGEVFGESSFKLERLRWTAGAGARFRFGDRTYVRIDVGANQETSAVIFNGGQAF